jgi:hypothetical protein
LQKARSADQKGRMPDTKEAQASAQNVFLQQFTQIHFRIYKKTAK